MPEISAYRQRTRAVRSAARERLRELREERLARRGDALRPLGPATAPDSHADIAVSRAASMVAAGAEGARAPTEGDEGLDHEPVADHRAGAAIDYDAPAVARSEGNDVLPSAPGSVRTYGPHADATQACDTDGSDVADACLSQDAVDVVEASGSSTPWDPAHQVPQESDLVLLPGAGDGLVWMLGQCGINTLVELARADADELTERMGLVGQMLDLQAWIAFARASTEERSRPQDSSRL